VAFDRMAAARPALGSGRLAGHHGAGDQPISDIPAIHSISIASPGEAPMPRFLIEVPHEAEKIACARAVRLLLQTGSHYLTHADFGCRDGDHRGWIIVEVDNKVEARNTLPPAYRAQAQIVGLNKFSLEELDALLKQHGG
jgi:hypothetical protein